MNDAELDRLLDAWEAPAPPPSLRDGLRKRFPRAERRKIARPLGWALAIAFASGMLAIGMEQSGANPWDFQLGGVLHQFYEHLVDAFELHRAAYIARQISHSEPKVYVDGQLAAPLEHVHAATIDVQVPGEGAYSLMTYRSAGMTRWVEAGRIHGNVIEFQAGAKQVRIECNRSIADSDRPVFVKRQQE